MQKKEPANFDQIIDRTKGIPVYLQIKAWIEGNINSGKWPAGAKIPPERELAEDFKVSRNTVSMALERLQQEGRIESWPGRGSFVTKDVNEKQMGRKDQLNFLIDKLLDQALDLGFDLYTVEDFFDLKAMERRRIIENISILLVDCNEEHLTPFIPEIRKKVKVSVDFLLLDEFIKKAKKDFLATYNLIVTTMTHLEEVKQHVKDFSEVLGITTTPNLEAMVRIARLNPETKTGLIGRSEKFAISFQRALKKAGISDLKFESFTHKDCSIEEFLKSVDLVVVSRSRETEVRKKLQKMSLQKEVIPFFYDMEEGSLDTIIAKVEDLKKRKHT